MKVNFKKYSDGLVPAIIQDFYSGKVLMLGFMNEQALSETQLNGKVTFFSRSKNRLWTKGEESGNYLWMKEMHIDCDEDTLLIKAIPTGPVCHTGNDTCWDEKNETGLYFIAQLEHIIADRKNNPGQKSYTAALLQSGINKVAQKVGEEAVELVIEAKDQNEEKFLGEAADLLFHYMILLQAKNYTMKDVVKVLQERNTAK